MWGQPPYFCSHYLRPRGEILIKTNKPKHKAKIALLALCFIAGLISPIKPLAQPLPNRIIPAGFRSLNAGNFVPNEIIIKVRPGATTAQINGLLAGYGLRKIGGNIISGTQRVRIPTNNIFEVAALLNREPLITYAEPNYIAQAEFFPNDPYYLYQWNFPMVDTELAWDLSVGVNIVVAVIDTGIAYENQGIYALAPDFAGTIFVPGWDFVNDDAYADDDNGHGTHIAGTIAQTTNNLLGTAGIAHGCSVMPIKALDNASNGLISDIADGIYFAVNNGAHIINISFGTYAPSITLEEAINYAYLNGVSVISSAGNNASSILHYPSSYEACICVGAIRYDQTRPFYANYGLDLDFCAPGGDLSVDQNLDGYQDGICQQTHNGTNFTIFEYALFQGTSCAAAHASGVAALVLSAAGGPLTPDELKNTLEATSIDLGPAGWDQDFGWGLINAFRAVQSVLPPAIVAAASPLVPLSFINPPLNPTIFRFLPLFAFNQYSVSAITPFNSAITESIAPLFSGIFSNLIDITRQSASNTNTFLPFSIFFPNPLLNTPANPLLAFDLFWSPALPYFSHPSLFIR